MTSHPKPSRTRRWRAARRTQRQRRPPDPRGTPHQRAINRLMLEIKSREPVYALFHSGVAWQALAALLDPGRPVRVEVERTLRLGKSRFVPDLVIKCARTERILLVIEVWHTHVVSARKKQAFAAAGLPWIEVKSWHVVERRRRRPLPVLDWGGPGLPRAPVQFDLFHCPSSRPAALIKCTTYTTCIRPPAKCVRLSESANGSMIRPSSVDQS